MGKSKSSPSPAPFQPTAPQSSWGNTMNYAPMSGYTRAGQGIAGVDMNAIQQRIMQQRQQQMQPQPAAPQPVPNARRTQPAQGYQVLDGQHTYDGRTLQEIQNVAREAPLQTRTNLTPMQHRILRGKGMWDEK